MAVLGAYPECSLSLTRNLQLQTDSQMLLEPLVGPFLLRRRCSPPPPVFDPFSFWDSHLQSGTLAFLFWAEFSPAVRGLRRGHFYMKLSPLAPVDGLYSDVLGNCNKASRDEGTVIPLSLQIFRGQSRRWVPYFGGFPASARSFFLCCLSRPLGAA